MDNICEGKRIYKFEYEPKKNRIHVFIILCAIFIILFFLCPFSFDETVLSNVDMEPFSEPVQEMINDGETFDMNVSGGIAHITPIANYKIYGRVLAKHYRPSRLPLALIYPYDVTIGFGDFKHKEVFDNIKVKMAGRVAYWSYSGNAYKKHLYKYFKNGSIEHYWTNNHLCPANENVRNGIAKLRKKDIVYMEGYLVKFKLNKKNGTIEEGTSSTSRNDDESFSGDNGYGSCEQIYVTRIVSRHGDYS